MKFHAITSYQVKASLIKGILINALIKSNKLHDFVHNFRMLSLLLSYMILARIVLYIHLTIFAANMSC